MAKKPRPTLTPVRNEMSKLRDDLDAVITAGEDDQGQLSESQLKKAKQTKDALDAALAAVTCVQSLSAY